jgi:hypothetical protein
VKSVLVFEVNGPKVNRFFVVALLQFFFLSPSSSRGCRWLGFLVWVFWVFHEKPESEKIVNNGFFGFFVERDQDDSSVVLIGLSMVNNTRY